MKRTPLATSILAAFLAIGLPAHAEATHHQGQAAQGIRALALDADGKWGTDAALRGNMAAIRDALAFYRKDIQSRTFMPEDGEALGATIEYRVAAILTDSRLQPPADTNLYLIVAELVQAADTMRGRSGPLPVKGASRAMRAVQMYATYFDHPGWIPVL